MRNFSNLQINLLVVQKERGHHEWTIGHILKELISDFEPDAAALHRLHAKCLSILKHSKAAILAYDKAINLDPNNYKALIKSI